MTEKVISVARDFSQVPAGRLAGDGPYNGEKFREEFLLPALKNNDFVIVDLDGVEGYGSSFLEEAFGGLVRNGYFTIELLNRKLNLRSSDRGWKIEIQQYISNARFND